MSKERIEAVKDRIKKAEQARTVAETQKKTAEEQQEEVVKEMAQHGVTPETVGDEIKNLETKIQGDLEKVEGMVPEV